MKKITLFILIAFTISTNAQNKILSKVYESYNSTTSKWVKFSGSNYKYDANNNLIEEQNFYANNNEGILKMDGKTVFTYNANNKVIEELEYAWNETTSQFEVDEKTTYTYVNNKLSALEVFEWNGIAWESNDKATVTYLNNLPNVISDTSLENGQWYETRTTYTYNANNKVASYIDEKLTGGQWVNHRKALYTYNANNKLITVKGADWDPFNNNWSPDANNVNEYTLDASGNRISSKESTYELSYAYDMTQLMTNFAHPFKDKTGFDYFIEDFPYINKVLTETSNSGNSRTTYNYNSLITLSVDNKELAATKISIYPNPAKSNINVSSELNAVEIFEISGKKVKSFQNPNTIFDVSNLEKGIYFLKGKTSEGKNVSQNLVKD